MIVRNVPPSDGERLNVLGHRQRIVMSSADTGGAFTLIDQVSPPGTGVPPHYHEREEETFHVVAGRVAFSLGDQTVTAEAGATLFIPRHTVHAFTVVGGEPATMRVLLTPGGAERMFRELSALPPGPPEMERILTICRGHGVIFL